MKWFWTPRFSIEESFGDNFFLLYQLKENKSILFVSTSFANTGILLHELGTVTLTFLLESHGQAHFWYSC